MKQSITGITAIKIHKLIEKKLNKTEFRKLIKNLLLEYRENVLDGNIEYIKRLEKEVEEFRLIKKLLK